MKKRFNLKRLLSKRNNGGFTLVEVIISCMLLGILVLGVVTFITPIMNMMTNNKKTARATMLAESINTYIMGTIRGAEKIEVFTGVPYHQAVLKGMDDDHSGSMLNLTIFMGAGDNASKYEVRCLAVHWVTDTSSPIAGKKKLMLTNCMVDNNFSAGYANKLKIVGIPTKVFDDSMYSDLYPMITVETFSRQDSSGKDTHINANGYKISSKIYLDMDCYSTTSDTARENGTLSFEGVSYVQCHNIGNASSIANVYSTQNGIDLGVSFSGNLYTENEHDYYYPSTYIYYIVRK